MMIGSGTCEVSSPASQVVRIRDCSKLGASPRMWAFAKILPATLRRSATLPMTRSSGASPVIACRTRSSKATMTHTVRGRGPGTVMRMPSLPSSCRCRASSGLRFTESSPAPKPSPTHAHSCRPMTVDGWVRATRTIAATSRGVWGGLTARWATATDAVGPFPSGLTLPTMPRSRDR